MRNTLAIFITLTLVGACDPSEAGKAAPEAKSAATAGAPAAADKGAAADADKKGFASLSECVQSCDDAKSKATDRATCRLNCDTTYGVKPTTPAAATNAAADPDPVGRVATCMGGCYERSGGVTDACVGACKAEIAGAANAPDANGLDHLGGCLAACHADKKLSSTDRATCGLNCEQAARVAGPKGGGPVPGVDARP
jgi:hypothetical protein